MVTSLSPGIQNNRADWRRVQQLYAQFSAIVDGRDSPVPLVLKGALADGLSRALAYYDGIEWNFIEDLMTVWGTIDGLATKSQRDVFTKLYYDNRLDADYGRNPIDNRRWPKPFEAAVETVRRLIHLNGLEFSLREKRIGTAAILGGSLSYGRFYNVYGAATTGKPSDIDLLLVCKDRSEVPRVVAQLKNLDGIDAEGYETIEARARVFVSLAPPSPAVFSHKLGHWHTVQDNLLEPFQIPSSFDISLHIISIDDFELLALTDRPIIVKEDSTTIVDYRNYEPNAQDSQRCFSGRFSHSERTMDNVEGGYLAYLPLYRMIDERFYPGVYHNLILPRFEVRWQSAQISIANTVRSFRWKVAERLREERIARPFEIQKLSLSHTRNALFAPHVIHSVDSDDIYVG